MGTGDIIHNAGETIWRIVKNKGARKLEFRSRFNHCQWTRTKRTTRTYSKVKMARWHGTLELHKCERNIIIFKMSIECNLFFNQVVSFGFRYTYNCYYRNSESFHDSFSFFSISYLESSLQWPMPYLMSQNGWKTKLLKWNFNVVRL